MKFSGVIFDADGTLIDSMPMWKNFGAEYLRDCGKEPDAEIDKIIQPYSFEKIADFFRSEYGLQKTTEEIVSDFRSRVERQYREVVPLKSGVKALFEKLSAMNIPMCVATSTDRAMVELALQRHGIRPHLVDCLSCGDFDTDKSKPDIFDHAAALLGTTRENTVVFEDSLACIETLKKAGYYTVCVADPFTAAYVDKLKELADYYVESLDDFGWMD